MAGALLLGADPSFGEWSILTGASVSYTTNIFQFSSASRLSIEQDPSQPIPVRDVLSKPSDIIWQPSLRVGRSWWSRLGVSELSFKTEGALYTENPSFNNAYYRLALRQELEPKKTAVELIYRYTPHQLLGPGRCQFSGKRIRRGADHLPFVARSARTAFYRSMDRQLHRPLRISLLR